MEDWCRNHAWTLSYLAFITTLEVILLIVQMVR